MPTDQDKVIRKLRAILSADVKGYSILMADDEVTTVHTINAYREVMAGLIQGHNGSVVDAKGDNVLAGFSSVVDAVRCSVDIQKQLALRNADLPEARKMEFRIGVNLGDVIDEEGTLYGDGVNVAARLESLADPGGVAISGTAFDQVRDKMDLGYQHLGEVSVKNIPRPIRVYKVLMEPDYAGKLIGEKRSIPGHLRWAAIAGVLAMLLFSGAFVIWNFYFRPIPMEVASVEKMAFPLPEKPSIAVLPFNNLSGDPAQDYIADGISENIISDLSKISEMFVISSNSTFTYKGKPVKVQQVSEELGVRYVLEGSAQKIGNRVRITAQLIDATTGHHLWSEKYDREMKDLFALQDEITHKIIVELQVKLTEGEQARVSHKSTTNLEAWSYAVRGLKLFELASKENNTKAMELFERAVELDPGYVWAWVRLAWTHVIASRASSPTPSESIKKVVEISKKVLILDESDSDVHALLGLVYLIQDQYEAAIAEGEKSLALGPTNAQAHVLLAVSMNAVGRFDDVIRLVKKAMRLHPYYPAYYLQWLGGAYRMTGRYEDALTVYNQLLDRSRKGEFSSLSSHLFLADVYAELGKGEEARNHTEEVLKVSPGFSLKEINKVSTFKYKDPAHLERRLIALRKAGIPVHPPLELPDKPSIAVLPFVNMSDDPEQEYFSDGMTEDIITGLSKVPDLFVIARNSVFIYKGKSINVDQVRKELGVRYVLEGSVRKVEDRVRITAQLIDANTEGHVWSERYDRQLKDIFKLQDNITKNIMEALQIKLTVGREARLHAKGTDSLDAYMKYLHGRNLLTKLNKEDNARGRQLLEEAIQIDPNYSPAYESLSESYFLDILFGASKSSEESMMTAIKYCQKAINLDETSSVAHAWLGFLYANIGKYDEGISLCERGVELGPSDEGAYRYLSLALRYAGRWEAAIKASKTAIRLNPFPEGGTLYGLGVAYAFTGQFEEAIEACRKATAKNPNDLLSHVVLAAVYAMADRTAEAKAASANVKRIEPKFSAEQFVKRVNYKRKEDIEILLKSLQKAGL